MSAKSGTPLADIEAALAARGQQMIGEPPHIHGEHQTIGGIFSTNLSGPRRVTGGAMRDHILGVRCVNGRGEIQKFGGRVLKNVTGLDLAKFLTGSFGTLAVLTEVTFKVLPIAEATGTLAISNLEPEAAVKVLSAGLGSPLSVSGAAYLPATKTAYLRIEDFTPSVKYRTEKLAAQLRDHGPADILDTPTSQTLWRDIRDCKPLPAGEATWRISAPPSAGPRILAALAPRNITGFLDWGGGLIWLSGPATQAAHDAVTQTARSNNAIWWLMNAPTPLRAAVDVLPPDPPALAAITQKIRANFDPRGLFNPGKLRAA
jgi:glycolate oxidase FAD binding subunit